MKSLIDVTGTYANQGEIVVPLRNSPKHIAPLAGLLAGADIPRDVSTVQLSLRSAEVLEYVFLDLSHSMIGSGRLMKMEHRLSVNGESASFSRDHANSVEGGRSKSVQTVSLRRQPDGNLSVEIHISYRVRSLGVISYSGNDRAVYRFPGAKPKR